MPKLASLAVLASLGVCGCLGPSNNSPSPPPVGSGAIDGATPPITADGSVLVDGAAPGDAGADAADAAIAVDAGLDAAALATFVTGLGSGVVAHSANFTLVTKTGNEPGGAGVKSSPSFRVISGVAPAATK